MKRPSSFALVSALGAVSLVVGAFSCGGSNGGSGFDNGGGDGGNQFGKDGGFGSGDGAGPCHGIGCNVDPCGGNSDATTISGKVYAPNGTLPLYNVIVYVPNDPVGAFAAGVACDACGKVSGNPITSTISNSDGTFTLKGVPNGPNIPLVFQVGKWRRQVTISNVAKCTDNPITDPNVSRLPAKQSEGDMPFIAVTTGEYDSISCVLPKMGIDPSEFGIQSDYPNKKVIFYRGNTGSGPSIKAGITNAQNLWGDLTELKKYDLTILSCEGDEELSDKPAPAQQNVYDYLNAGGRTFETDFMYTWMSDGPTPLPTLLSGFVGGAPVDSNGNYSIDTTFPKGQALDEWLQAVGGSAGAGQIYLGPNVFENFSRVGSDGQRWVYGDSDKIISFTTPLSEPDETKRCGKSYFMDVHVSVPSIAGGSEDVNTSFPTSCNSDPLTAQEKAMVFFMMDLASCIQNDKGSVNPPR